MMKLMEIDEHLFVELKVVTARRNIAQTVIHDSRHNIHIFLEHGSGIDGERRTGLIARPVRHGIVV